VNILSPAHFILRHRRPFHPGRIPGLVLWYSASDPRYDSNTYEQAIPTLFDSSGNGFDATQGTGTNQAITLTHGRNYLRGTGVTGNNATCPGVTNTGSFAVRAKYAPPGSWASGTIRRLQRQTDTAGLRKYAFQVSVTGELVLALYLNATAATVYTSTAVVPFSSGQIGFVGAFWDQAAGEIIFETSVDGITWTQLGTTLAASTATNGNTGAGTICVLGNIDAALADATAGRLFWTTYSLTRGGTPIRYFDASRGNFNSAAIGSATGETWTINKSGLNAAMIVSARAFMPLTDDFYDISASAADVLRNVSGGTIIATTGPTGLPVDSRMFWVSSGSGAGARLTLYAAAATNALGSQGRREDGSSVQTVFEPSQVTVNEMAVFSTSASYAAANLGLYKNGQQVKFADPFQTPGSSSDTASIRIRAFASAGDTPIGFWSGPVTDLALYNRALTNAQIFGLSRYFAGRTGGAVTV
jgi:hypothetical protein